MSVVEFGVAGGNGLLEVESVARLATDALGVRVDVHGFDRGVGLPEPHGYRDLPYRWKDGFFEMDVDVLEARLTTAELILGDLSATVPEFAARLRSAPVGFVSVDLDYYSSTVDAFALFKAEATRLLPRVWCYLDDIIGDDVSLHNAYVGELAAVGDFNAANAQRKIAPIYGLTRKRIWPAMWCDQMLRCTASITTTTAPMSAPRSRERRSAPGVAWFCPGDRSAPAPEMNHCSRLLAD